MNKKIILLLSIFIFFLPSYIKASEKSLTVDECIIFALENNSSIKIAQKQLDGNYAKIKEINAGKYPRINVFGIARKCNYQTGYMDFSLSPPSPSLTDDKQIYLNSDNFDTSMTLEVSQIVYDGGDRHIKLIAANLEKENAEINIEAVKEDVSYKVKLAFYSALKTKDQFLLSGENVKTGENHFKLAKALFDSGLVPQVDTVTAEVALTKAKMLFSQAKNEYDKSLNNLNTAMGRELEESIEIYGNNSYVPLSIDEKLIEEKAINSSFGMRQINLALSQQEDSISNIEGLIKPTINANAGYVVRNNNSIGKKGFYFEVGLNLPIFNVADRAEMEKFQAKTEEVKKQKELLERTIKLEVKNSLLDLKSAESYIEIAEKEVELSLLQLQIAEGKYKQGAGTIMEVTNSQLNLMKSKTDYINAIYNYKIALATVEHVANIKVSSEE
jgi:outer membrane protein TolC